MRRILVCVATGAEHDACQRGLRAAASTTHELLLTGVGPARAARALAARLGRGAPPDLVVSSGFAGALSPVLALSSWVTAVRIGEWNGVARVPVDDVLIVEGPPGLARCEVLSASALVSVGTIRAGVTAPSPPTIVDMESAALAREAGRSRVAFAVLRVISDTPAHPLPSFLSPFTDALAATATSSRLAHAARGVRGAVADPRGVARLVREGTRWLTALEAGWAELARSASL